MPEIWHRLVPIRICFKPIDINSAQHQEALVLIGKIMIECGGTVSEVIEVG